MHHHDRPAVSIKEGMPVGEIAHDSRQGALDTFLKPYVRPAVADLSKHIVGANGLDGSAGTAGDAVYGRNDDPAIQAQYRQQQLKREEHQSGE